MVLYLCGMDAIFELPQIKAVAKALWKEGKANKVWIFHASMGTGKTSFIHALCEVLEVKDTVSSPSYAIINEYVSPIAGTIYHMDWYRLKDEEEAIQAGIEEAIVSGNLCLIEWPEKAAGLLPEKPFEVYMEILNEKMRRLYTERLEE
jgi:tRNA threonylcarbamoyladenosine biosynthesis protein TsaE